MAAYPGIMGTAPWPFGVVWGGEPFWRGLSPAEPPDAPPPRAHAAGNGADTDGAPRVSMELFVSPDSPTCAAALRNIERALVGVQPDQVRLEICDVSQHPGRADEAHVCFTPTLVIRAADQPPIWIFGALTDSEVLTEHLEVAGLQPAPRGD
jgi:circadian clock protein KaiB